MTDEGAERAAAATLIVCVLLFALCIMGIAGCAVPPKAADQIRVDTAAADGMVRLWDSLDHGQQYSAFLKLRQGMWVLRFSLLDEMPRDKALRAKILEWSAK